jgi:ribosomal protein S18 acetylase RimI-like enzyme
MSAMTAEIRLLKRGDERVLEHIAPNVFDGPIDADALARFLRAPHHHLAVAVDDGAVVGFVSALHYEHPDKVHPEFWINEVGVLPSHQRRGIANALLQRMFAHARALKCREAWVLTDRANTAAMALYESAGGDVPSDHVMITFHLDAAGDDD